MAFPVGALAAVPVINSADLLLAGVLVLFVYGVTR